MLEGRSRSKTPKSSIASGVSMASKGAAGNGDACPSPRATPRISSRSSLSDLRISVELERNTFGFTRSLNRREEVANQFVRAPELVRHRLLCSPESMPMVVCKSPSDTVRIVIAQQSCPVDVMQREGVLDAVRSDLAQLGDCSPESDAPPI